MIRPNRSVRSRGGVLILMVGVALLSGVAAFFLFFRTSSEQPVLKVGYEVVQLRRCELVGAAAWGRYGSITTTTYFCQQGQTVLAYTASGKILDTYTIPDGFDVVDVSDVGDISLATRTFFCRERATRKVFVCLVE